MLRRFFTAAACVAVLLTVFGHPAPQRMVGAAKTKPLTLPRLAFEENRGQVDSNGANFASARRLSAAREKDIR